MFAFSSLGWKICLQIERRASFTALIFLLPVPVPMCLLLQKLATSYIHLLTMILTHKDHVCKHYWSNRHCRGCGFRSNRYGWPLEPCQDWVSGIPSAGDNVGNERNVSGTMALFQQHPGLGRAHCGLIHGHD